MSLKERVVRGKKNTYREFYALSDISFKVYKGSTVGLVGQNGCGKSTLLKIINRTMFPEKGKVAVSGKVASLIELGAGFHPELSGRENIYTNASVFGITKNEIEKRIPAIIKFSELEEFIDNPIRTYSSGMYARLAFSVAINVDAEILLVDEILGVGDMNFQAKCANKIYEMKKRGVTIVLVTHDMGTIDRLCDYAIWLDHGQIMAEGDSKEVQYRYKEFMAIKQGNNIIEENKENTLEAEDDHNLIEDDNQIDIQKNETVRKGNYLGLGDHFGTYEIEIVKCQLFDSDGIEKRTFQTGDMITLDLQYQCNTLPSNFQINVGIEIKSGQDILVYGTNTTREGFKNISIKQKGRISIQFPNMNLIAGEYYIGVAISDEGEGVRYDYYPDIARFNIYSPINDIGLSKISHCFIIDGNNLT
jgi:ABC-2 type transport system ATP-binding protein